MSYKSHFDRMSDRIVETYRCDSCGRTAHSRWGLPLGWTSIVYAPKDENQDDIETDYCDLHTVEIKGIA